MTLTIDISPEVERALKESAQSNGQSLPDYVAALLAHVAHTSPDNHSVERQSEIAARLAALERIGSYHARAGLPPLSDDAVADVYREREDAQL